MESNNRVVVITGGAKGIGKAIADAYGSKGYRLIILGRDTAALKRTEAAFMQKGYTVIAETLDVTDALACKNMVEHIVLQQGGIDILILNAGLSMRGTFEETNLSVARTIMETNYFGSINMIKPALQTIKARKGSIVFISSIMALQGLSYTSHYSASKAALKVLSESLRCELSHDDVHVGIIHVGMTQNEVGKRLFGPDGESIRLRPIKRAATRQSVAKKVLTCTDKRIAELTLTPLGKFASFMYRHFPRLTRYITMHRSGVGKFYR